MGTDKRLYRNKTEKKSEDLWRNSTKFIHQGDQASWDLYIPGVKRQFLLDLLC